MPRIDRLIQINIERSTIMPKFKSEIAKIKHKVLREIASLAFNGDLVSEIDKLPRRLTEAGITHYRCCVYKERAVLAERAKFALGFSPREVDKEAWLSEIAEKSIESSKLQQPIFDIFDVACDRCPIDKYIVSDACRGCVAHYCVNACPKKAITVVARKAHIDQDKCIECGLCSKACQFHAIVEVSRPCERSCPTQAIKPGPRRNSLIDRDLCVSCGVCITSCPFGAIADKSQIVDVIKWLKEGKKVIAAVAPAVVGQFGQKVELGQVLAALDELGFSATAEVAVGADIVAELDAKEFEEMVDEKGWVASSCCPAFVNYVEKNFPDLKDHVVNTPSPMVVMGRKLKAEDPESKVVFIGPCIAKKEEALAEDSGIDAVLTFEEIAAVFAAKEIEPGKLEPQTATHGQASKWGRGFAVSGGVAQAVRAVLGDEQGQEKIQAVTGNGIDECKHLLTLARSGRLPGNFLEGMACVGGCVGGPAALVQARESTRAIDKLCR